MEQTKNDVQFEWTDECKTSFRNVKAILMGADIMGYPLNNGGVFTMDTDASGLGIGAVLLEKQSCRERVISYGSRNLNKAERNNGTRADISGEFLPHVHHIAAFCGTNLTNRSSFEFKA